MKRIVLALCAGLLTMWGSSLIPGAATSADEAPRLTLTNLLRTELEFAEGVEVIVSLVEVPPETSLPTHYHPGEEFVFVLEGSATVWQKGKEDTHLKKGDVFKVPFKQIHTGKTAEEGARLLVFRAHQKGEPERVLSD